MKIYESGEDQTINCPRYHGTNPAGLIYWAVLNCASVLHPGRTACNACRRTAILVNTRFCHDCGQPTGYLSESEGVHRQENPVR